MAYSATSLDPEYRNATSDNNPILIGHNILADATRIQWHTSDVTGGLALSDHSGTDLEAWKAVDGRPWVTSGPDATGSNAYLYAEVPSSTIDACLVHVTTFPNNGTVSLQVADSFPANTNVTTLQTVSGLTSNTRAILFDFDGTTNRYNNVAAVRLKFSSDNVNNNWRVSAVHLGRRAQLSRCFQLPFDPESLSAGRVVRSSSGKAADVYSSFSGAQDISGIYSASRLSTDSRYAISDWDTIQTLYTESNEGTEPVVFCMSPADYTETIPHRAMIGFLSPRLEFKTEGPNSRNWSFDFAEFPPFWSSL